MMKWAEYANKIREEKGISFGQLARLTRTSYSYWHNQMNQVKGPPTLDKARRLAEALEMNVDHFINLVFRDRILYHLEREGLENNHPTKEILAFIKSLQSWAPEMGQELRYIMSTLLKTLGFNFANEIKELAHKGPEGESPNLTEELRNHSFPSGAGTAQDDFSEDLE